MTPLRQRMVAGLQLCGLSEKTQESYVRAVRQLAEHQGKSPDCIGEEELRLYLLYLKNDEQVSPSAFTIALCGIKFFFQHTLRREWTTPESTQGSSWCVPSANTPCPSRSAWRKCSASWAVSASRATVSA